MEYSMFTGVQFNYLGSLGVALGYTGLVILISKSRSSGRFIRTLSAVGRMAFSNYILMTLISTFIFYGHGLGLFGCVERTYQLLFVLGIWIILLVISPLWLRRYNYGPLEGIWRRLTYLKI
jgi:uncharacterized protein